MKHRLALLLLLAAGVLLSGCTNRILAKKIVQAPNRSGLESMGANMDKMREATQNLGSPSWDLLVSHPATKLNVKVFEPKNYGLVHKLNIEPGPKPGTAKANVEMNWKPPLEVGPEAPLRGTLILLHGIYVSKEAMIHWALYLAESGYRCVLVDLRGHGQSTGDWITYGAVETRDLAQLIDELQRRRLAGERVGVLGMSYGGSIGLMLAARDERVGAVIALQPFCDAREAVPEFVRANFGAKARKLSDDDFTYALNRAQSLAAFSWEDTDVRAAMENIRIPVLFYHGSQDTWLDPRHSRELVKNAPKGSRLVILGADNHITLSLRLDPIAKDVVAWFEEHLVETAP